VNITGLDTSTTYYVRAYAINAIDTSFGNVDTVTTLKAAQSIIFEPISVKTYGDTVFTLSASATSGLDVSFTSSNPEVAMVSNDSVTITGVGTTTITASQPGNASFAAADDMEQILVVDKDTLWVTAHDKSKTYGQTNPELTYNYSDFAYNEDSTVIDNEPDISTTANNSSGAGTYEITLSGGNDDNYVMLLENGTLTIEKAPLTVTALDKSKLYGMENPPLSLDYNGFVNGEDVSVIDEEPVPITSADTGTSVGSVDITPAGGSDDNYEFIFVNGTLTIQKAALVASAQDVFRNYGEPNPLFPINISGFVNNEDTSVIDEIPVASTSANTNSATGTYDITLSGGSDNNYEFTLLNGILTIQKAPQTINLELPERVPSDTGSFEINVTASSGLPVSIRSSDNQVATVDGTSLVINGLGTTTITVSQEGNENFNAASDVIRQLTVYDAVGLINIQMSSITLYPNPVKSKLYLQMPKQAKNAYAITDMFGKVIHYGNIENNCIDFDNVQPGVYFLTINNETFRIVKQ
jgi:hypothetical protein